jgi:WhiB family redox-sensing transcriptional regulator
MTTDDTADCGAHLTIPQVARTAAASTTAVARMVREGLITARRDPTNGTTWRIPQTEVAKVVKIRAEWRASGLGVANRRTAPPVGGLDWQDDGACMARPNLFQGPYGESAPRKRERETAAIAICATCPVMQTCRGYALAGSERYGVWGGLTQEALRSAARRKYKQVAA